jgi:hypothetical protein
MIKRTRTFLLFFVLIVSAVAKARADETIQSSELGKSVHVIGRLGKELGTVVTIQCVSYGKQTRAKEGIFTFDVVKVGDDALTEPVTMAFRFDPAGKMPPSEGTYAAKYRGYETGSFVGVPPDVRLDSDEADTSTADAPWQFHTSFKVLMPKDAKAK